MKKISLFSLSFQEMRRRSLSFLPFFIMCISGLFILYSLLFFEYGNHLYELRTSQSRYHILLPKLNDKQVDEIRDLPYVQSVEPFRYGDSITAYIKLKDNDPLKLYEYCERTIKDVGLDKTPAYRNNVIYQTSGPMENWINGAYYDLATTPFIMRSLGLTSLCMMFVVLYMISAIINKVRSDYSEYSTLRSLGYRKIDIYRYLSRQYLILYVGGSIIALLLSLGIYKLLSVLLKRIFTDDYLQLDFAFPAKEVGFWFLTGAFLLLLGSTVVMLLFKRDIMDGISGRIDESISFVKATSIRFIRRISIGQYNLLRAWRCRVSILGRIVKKTVLLILPIFFLIMTIMLYGMREQAEFDRDFGLFSLAPNYVTEEIADAVSSLDGVERTELRIDYGEGNYGQLLIYAEEGREPDIEREIEAIANAYYLQYYNDYRNKIMNVEQSDIFTIYYLMQTIVLLFASVMTMVSEEIYHLHRRKPEIAVLKSLGLLNSYWELFSVEIITIMISMILSGILTATINVVMLGVSYLRIGFIILAVLCFFALYLLPHILLFRKTYHKTEETSITELIEGDV